MLRKLPITFFFSLIILPSFLIGQSEDKTDGSQTIKLKTNVLVVNSVNQYESGIKKSEIRIYEDDVKQNITYFAEKKPKLNLALVIDNSGSLKFVLKEIIRAAKLIAQNLQKGDEAFVIRFINSGKIEILQDWTSDQKLLTEAFDSMYIEGGSTAVFDALYLSAKKLRERSMTAQDERYAIVLISDVEERNSYYKYGDVTNLFSGVDIPVYIISYAAQARRNAKLAHILSYFIALDTGGASFVLPKKKRTDALKNALAKIIFGLRSNYVVGYTSSNQSTDGSLRKVRIEIADSPNGKKKRKAIHVGSYFAPGKKKVRK